jgi:hypothetical protein
MYSYDANTNCAIELRAERVRRVQNYGTRQMPEQSAPSWAAYDQRQTRPAARKAVLKVALATATPVILLVVWGLLAH